MSMATSHPLIPPNGPLNRAWVSPKFPFHQCLCCYLTTYHSQEDEKCQGCLNSKCSVSWKPQSHVEAFISVLTREQVKPQEWLN